MEREPNPEKLNFIKQYGALQSCSRFSYVTIHNFEGQQALELGSANIGKPKVVDCYWVIGDSGIFVSTSCDLKRNSFVSYSPRVDRIIEHEFFVVTKSPLNQETIERILKKLANWIEENLSSLPKSTTVIANADYGS
jgi:hypothetical protein